MRMSQEEKEKSHERIIVSAARLLRERGVEGASVNDVMSDAGLTHGGFYKHFDTKDALLASSAGRRLFRIRRSAEGRPGRARLLELQGAVPVARASRTRPVSAARSPRSGPSSRAGPRV